MSLFHPGLKTRGYQAPVCNPSYQGEHLGGYAGESVILRYNPRDITTIWVYQMRSGQEAFLTRAHAQGLETEMLSYGEAQAMSRRLRESGKAISNHSILNEVRDRDAKLMQMRRAHQRNGQGSKPQRKRMAQRQEEFQQESLWIARESSEGMTAKAGSNPTTELPFGTPEHALTETHTEPPIANDENELQIRIKPVRVYANYDEIELEARSNESARRQRNGREG